jgi:hypothetical protein
MNIKTITKNLSSAFRLPMAILTLIFVLGMAAPVLMAQAVLQGYKSDESLQRGMVVTVSKDDPQKVEVATDKTFKDAKGVVADQNDSPVRISSEEQNVFVATSGRYEMLVSNENGSIKPGDYLAGSSLDGIAMKAKDDQSTIVARSAGVFQGEGDSIGNSEKDGRKIEFGRIQADIEIGKNPNQKPPVATTALNNLEEVASTIADKPVSPLRVYLALIVLLITAGVTFVMLVSGVRSAVISIGRNPLSRNLIFRGMFQMLLVSMIIFITGLFGVYLLIKL